MIIGMVLGLAVALLVGLVNVEKTENPKRILMFKTPLSLLFLVAWTLQPAQHSCFAGLVLIALLFCLGGDVLLAFGSRGTFLLGLVSFLIGHVMYAAAFFVVGEVGPLMAVGVILLMVAAAFTWWWLEPHLWDMKIPVLAYIVVISIMVCGAFGIVGDPTIPAYARGSVFAGAILFYISDLFVARQRFVVGAHVNRMVGLPLYYAAQFLLAFSAAWIPG
ncbi:MAG: lysoplasmalogenase [Desulfosarcina sp.]|nr:lysoplasmalogenase [Desulfosarcina sp.]MBC2744175.1 lysoplasmalogenase [Desulfosarcina sp.]MBC2767084.1 lysoplasmalogenase [Desulfosarcina sp.]